jgi:predicted hydrocarbon binding protein
MKGIVFNLLEEVVSRHHGLATWDTLLETVELEGAYTSLGNYPDEEIVKLVGAASAALGQPPGEVLRWFGREAMPFLAERYPEFFTAHQTTRPFILSLNNVIHAEVHKLYPGAVCPHFRHVEDNGETLRLAYRSPRKLCDLAHGFIEGASVYYNETVTVDHLKCMSHGDPECELQIAFR